MKRDLGKTLLPPINLAGLGKAIALLVGCVIVVGCIADVVVTGDLMGYPGPVVQQSLHRLSLMRDSSMPTWVASVILLACSVLLAIGWRVAIIEQSAYRKQWAVLSVIFLALSMDEVAMIHELSGFYVERFAPSTAEMGGAFSYVWVLAAIPLLAVLTIYFLPWLFSLPKRTITLFLASAIIYVGGAVGVEMLNAFLESSNVRDVTYALTTSIEEAMEFSGSLLFACSLVDYLRAKGVSLSIVQRPVAELPGATP